MYILLRQLSVHSWPSGQEMDFLLKCIFVRIASLYCEEFFCTLVCIYVYMCLIYVCMICTTLYVTLCAHNTLTTDFRRVKSRRRKVEENRQNGQ